MDFSRSSIKRPWNALEDQEQLDLSGAEYQHGGVKRACSPTPLPQPTIPTPLEPQLDLDQIGASEQSLFLLPEFDTGHYLSPLNSTTGGNYLQETPVIEDPPRIVVADHDFTEGTVETMMWSGDHSERGFDGSTLSPAVSSIDDLGTDNSTVIKRFFLARRIDQNVFQIPQAPKHPLPRRRMIFYWLMTHVLAW